MTDLDFDRAAKEIYRHSTNCLMAHTIRATVNLFTEKSVALDVKIEPDWTGARILGDSVSVLLTNYDPTEQRVVANICIHRHANRELARFCIAHEIYHLLLELESFQQSGREVWPSLEASQIIEDSCDGFASRLCFMHDQFYANSATVDQMCRFGDGVFEKPIRSCTLSHLDWPKPFLLDPDNPFYKEMPHTDL